jgi:hypothetical protein
VIDANVSVDIEHRGFLWSLGHPCLTKLGAPGKSLLLVGYTRIQ